MKIMLLVLIVMVGTVSNTHAQTNANWSDKFGFASPSSFAPNGRVHTAKWVLGYLIIGGEFSLIGQVQAKNLAIWIPHYRRWFGIAGGTDGSVLSMDASVISLTNNSHGLKIAAGGVFTSVRNSGGVQVQGNFNNVGMIDITIPIDTAQEVRFGEWRDVNGGVTNTGAPVEVKALHITENGLLIGGMFSRMGGTPIQNIGLYNTQTNGYTPAAFRFQEESFLINPIQVQSFSAYNGYVMVTGAFNVVRTINDVRNANMAILYLGNDGTLAGTGQALRGYIPYYSEQGQTLNTGSCGLITGLIETRDNLNNVTSVGFTALLGTRRIQAPLNGALHVHRFRWNRDRANEGFRVSNGSFTYTTDGTIEAFAGIYSIKDTVDGNGQKQIIDYLDTLIVGGQFSRISLPPSLSKTGLSNIAVISNPMTDLSLPGIMSTNGVFISQSQQYPVPILCLAADNIRTHTDMNKVRNRVIAGGDFLETSRMIGFMAAMASPYSSWELFGVRAGTNLGFAGKRVIDVASIGRRTFVLVSSTGGSGELGDVVEWTGEGWTSLSASLRSRSVSIYLKKLLTAGTEHDPRLYVFGSFDSAATSGVATIGSPAIAEWDGQQGWRMMSVPQGTQAMGIWNAAPVVAGQFNAPFGQPDYPFQGVARWSGTAWQQIGVKSDFEAGGSGGGMQRYTVVAGNEARLYIAGKFSIKNGSVNNLAEWDGIRWQAICDEFTVPSVFCDNCVSSIAFRSVDGEQRMVVAGEIQSVKPIGAPAIRGKGVYEYNGRDWNALSSGEIQNGEYVSTVATCGDDVYAAGNFQSIGSLSVGNGVARWNGREWSPLGDAFSASLPTEKLTSTISGTSYWIGGQFSDIGGKASWNIAQWSLDEQRYSVRVAAQNESAATIPETGITFTGDVTQPGILRITVYHAPPRPTPPGTLRIGSRYWKIEAPGLVFSNGRIRIPRRLAQELGVTDSVRWFKRGTAQDVWQDIGAEIRTLNGVEYYQSTVAFSGFSEFMLADVQSTVSVNSDEANQGRFEVSPFPASEYVTIRSQSSHPMSITVLSILGSTVLNASAVGEHRLDLTALPSGSYLLCVTASSQRHTYPLIIRR